MGPIGTHECFKISPVDLQLNTAKKQKILSKSQSGYQLMPNRDPVVLVGYNTWCPVEYCGRIRGFPSWEPL